MPASLTLAGGGKGAVSGRDAPLAAAVQHRMGGNDAAIFDDAHLIGRAVHIDDTAAGDVGHAVEVAVDRDHAVAGEAALEPQHRLEWTGRQLLQLGLFLRKMLCTDAPGGGMHARIGDVIEPLPQLRVQVFKAAEAAAEEEVFPNVAERTFHLALGLGAIGFTGFGQVAVMTRELDQGAVVDDVTGLRILTAEHGAHAVIEDLLRRAAERLESGRMTAQQGWQVLVQHEPAPQYAAVAEHQGEQPYHVFAAGLVGEVNPEVCEVHLRLAAGRGLEAHFVAGRLVGPDGSEELLQCRVAAAVAKITVSRSRRRAVSSGYAAIRSRR